MVDDLEIQDIIQEMRKPVFRPMNREYFQTRLADAIDGYDSCERCAGDKTIDYLCPYCMGNGCSHCHGNGMIVEPCPECQVTVDEGLEVFEDIKVAV